MANPQFKGHEKKGKWLLLPFENWLFDHTIPWLPKWIETYHLTYSTLLWSAAIVFLGYYWGSDVRWLLLMNLFIFAQYITDVLDGRVGRYRDTGLILWGFFMDHFLDYVFLGAVGLGYYYTFHSNGILIILMVFAAMGSFISTLLNFYATNEFKISEFLISPSEWRMLLIGGNFLIVFLGRELFEWLLYPILICMIGGLVFYTYRSQKHLWEQDMINKANHSKKNK